MLPAPHNMSLLKAPSTRRMPASMLIRAKHYSQLPDSLNQVKKGRAITNDGAAY